MSPKPLLYLLSIFALAAASTVQAEPFSMARATKDISYFATLGMSDVGYSDNGFALKLGAELPGGAILPAIPWLGATAFYAYASGENSYWYSPCSRWKITHHAFAVGPTANYAFSPSFSAQGRVHAGVSRYEVDSGCSSWSSNSTGLRAGAGASLKWNLSPAFALRLDLDTLGHSTNLLSFGANFRF